MKILFKKSAGFLFTAFILLFVSTIPVSACTVFSVKSSSNVYYGKNWDYSAGSDETVTFRLHDLGSGLSSLDFNYSGFLTSSINSDGFFASVNDVYNIQPMYNAGENNIDITYLRQNSYSMGFKTVSDLKGYIADKKVLCFVYPEHVFFADKNGNSCVVETDNTKHYVIESGGNFLAATNFPLYTLGGRLDDFNKAGCYRYKSAYEKLNQNHNNFDLDKGMEALKVSAQGATFYSFIYDANENCVYLCLRRDFDAIWKFSFSTKKISTYKGFKNHTEFTLDSQGVRYTDLWQYQTLNKSPAADNYPSRTETSDIGNNSVSSYYNPKNSIAGNVGANGGSTISGNEFVSDSEAENSDNMDYDNVANSHNSSEIPPVPSGKSNVLMLIFIIGGSLLGLGAIGTVIFMLIIKNKKGV